MKPQGWKRLWICVQTLGAHWELVCRTQASSTGPGTRILDGGKEQLVVTSPGEWVSPQPVAMNPRTRKTKEGGGGGTERDQEKKGAD